MPTENLEGSPSESGTKAGKPSATLVKEALAHAKPSLTATPEPMPNEMSKAEALAVAWTGLEALARMKQANLFRSRKNGSVVIELLATELTEAEGLKVLA